MSKRSREHRISLLSKYVVPVFLSVGITAAGYGGYTYSLLQKEKEISEENTQFMEEQIALIEESKEKRSSVEQHIPEPTVEEEEVIVEEPPREYYSSEYLDSDYEFSDWSTFNQVNLLGIKNMSFDEILDKYPDIVGGIEIPGTNIKNLIVRSPDQNDRDYYLHKDLNGNYFYDGIVYEDNFRTSLAEPQYNQDRTMTIFGHNMNGYLNTGALTRLQFHDFQNYLGNQKYADEHKTAIIHYIDGTVGIGELYSVVRFLRDETGVGFITPDVNDEESFYQYADLLKGMSEINSDVYPDYEAGDQLISFQTCSHVRGGLMLVTFVVPRVKQITCEEQRYLLDENSNNINNNYEDVQVRNLTK
jgi:hypothetical protein